MLSSAFPFWIFAISLKWCILYNMVYNVCPLYCPCAVCLCSVLWSCLAVRLQHRWKPAEKPKASSCPSTWPSQWEWCRPCTSQKTSQVNGELWWKISDKWLHKLFFWGDVTFLSFTLTYCFPTPALICWGKHLEIYCLRGMLLYVHRGLEQLCNFSALCFWPRSKMNTNNLVGKLPAQE